MSVFGTHFCSHVFILLTFISSFLILFQEHSFLLRLYLVFFVRNYLKTSRFSEETVTFMIVVESVSSNLSAAESDSLAQKMRVQAIYVYFILRGCA